jgi:hypothetical protein
VIVKMINRCASGIQSVPRSIQAGNAGGLMSFLSPC